MAVHQRFIYLFILHHTQNIALQNIKKKKDTPAFHSKVGRLSPSPDTLLRRHEPTAVRHPPHSQFAWCGRKSLQLGFLPPRWQRGELCWKSNRLDAALVGLAPGKPVVFVARLRRRRRSRRGSRCLLTLGTGNPVRRKKRKGGKKRHFSASVTGRRRSSSPSTSLKGQKAECYILNGLETHTPLQVVWCKRWSQSHILLGFSRWK